MKYPKGTPAWVSQAAESQADGAGELTQRLKEVAQKLAVSAPLAPLWKAVEKQIATDSFLRDFFGAEGYFSHLVKSVSIALDPPSGYAAMSPAKLDEWRNRTQKHALDLLGDLMEGYPVIEEKEDEAHLVGPWVLRVGMHLGTTGAESDPGKVIELDRAGKIKMDRWVSGVAVASRLPMILRYLIEWLDGEVAEDHTVTHAASKNVHRNSFIRSMTAHFERCFDTPMRKHVFTITALFFDMEGMTENDIKKVAPANRGGKIPARFTQNLPG